MNAALAAFIAAVDQLRSDLLREQDDSQLPIIAAIIFDALGAHALAAVTSALQTIRRAELSNLNEIVSSATGSAPSKETAVLAYDAFSSVSSSSLDKVSKSVVDATKQRAVAMLKQQIAHEKTDQRAAKLDYIKQLTDSTEIAFQALREQPPGYATDAQLLTLWQGFDARLHASSAYYEAIAGKLARYEKSGIQDIGRDDGLRAAHPENPNLGAKYVVKRDIVVVRVRFKSGYPDQLAYARKDWWFNTTNTRPDERAPEKTLPLDETRWKGLLIPDAIRWNLAPEFERFVDPEFEEAALERHVAVWGKQPEVVEADDSSWVWDKERSRKARENDLKERADKERKSHSRARPSWMPIPRLPVRDIPANRQEKPPATTRSLFGVPMPFTTRKP